MGNVFIECQSCKRMRADFVFINRVGCCDMCEAEAANTANAVVNVFKSMAGTRFPKTEANKQAAKIELQKTDYLEMPSKWQSMDAVKQNKVIAYRVALRACVKSGDPLPKRALD